MNAPAGQFAAGQSLYGLSPGIDRGDARMLTLYKHLTGEPMRGLAARPVTTASLRATWAFSTSTSTHYFHEIAEAVAAWDTRGPLFGVQSSCGKTFVQFAASLDPPRHLQLCDACALADMRVPSVYRFFDASGRLLYVGFTENPLERFLHHSYQSPWWHLQVRHELEQFADVSSALAAEAGALDSEAPLFNKCGPGARRLTVAA